MESGRKALLAGGCVIAMAVMLPASVLAQTGEGAGPPPETRNSASAQQGAGPADARMDDIVVTARRREESLQTVPMSITAVTGEALTNSGIRDVYALQQQSPALSVASSSGNSNDAVFGMRGQEQSFGGSGPAVVPYFADVPLLSQANVPFLDLANVQVLKGPQGTLFGRNTTGGAILFVPARPSDERAGFVDFQAGNYRLVQAQAVVNLPLIPDVLSLRLAGQTQTRDGYTRNLLTSEDLGRLNNKTWRASLLFTPNDSFENYLIYDGYHARETTNGSTLDVVTPGGFADLVYGQLLADKLAEQKARSPHDVEASPSLFSRKDLWGVINTTTVRFGDLFVKNIFGYRTFKGSYAWDQDGSGLQIVDGMLSADIAQTTEEAQFGGTTLGGDLTFIAGYYHESLVPKGRNVTDAVILGAPYSLSNQRWERSDAVYAQATYDLHGLVEGLKFTAGGRYTWDTRKFDPLDGTARQVAKFRSPSYNFSLDYAPHPGVLVYAATRRGYKSGGFNNSASITAGFDRVFRPEHLTDYEVGFKSDWRAGDVRGRFNLALYTGRYTGIQRLVQALVDGNLVTPTINAGRGRISGVEAEYGITPTSFLELSGFYSYTRAKYTEFVLPDGTDASANAFPNTPRHKLGLTGTVRIPLQGEGENVALSANFYYQSRQRFDTFNAGTPVAGHAYRIVNLRAAWNNALGPDTSIAAFANNVFDEDYQTMGANIYSTFLSSASVYGPPRMYGLQFHAAF